MAQGKQAPKLIDLSRNSLSKRPFGSSRPSAPNWMGSVKGLPGTWQFGAAEPTACKMKGFHSNEYVK